ncbi:TetR/AcrR family transcriptional regulator [Pseudomonas tohonis]|uniref:TetR/AcrR family transcriptional regulator n=1 Tax=Pseudomonas tohonis TaxID=2725477 RepID=UPI0021DA9E67|nr:TetR/AcrR family transcriptional regulator [Pseudomonas tohonis]UXY50951.1 TetR/AcrR family transcriptional regulator [Pseudomonas tohonis]
MRYSEDHKAETHKRIIAEASRRFRADGIDATGLQPLMKALGLTHGGFYAHFKSKDALVQEALRAAANDASGQWAKVLAKPEPLKTLFKRYLSPEHRDNPDAGCPLPTMSSELGQRGQASPISDEVVGNLLRMIEKETGDPQEAMAMVATMVGALSLSRSVADEALSKRILEDACSNLTVRLEEKKGGKA